MVLLIGEMKTMHVNHQPSHLQHQTLSYAQRGKHQYEQQLDYISTSGNDHQQAQPSHGEPSPYPNTRQQRQDWLAIL